MAKDRKPRTVIGPGTGKTFKGRNPVNFIPGQRKMHEIRAEHLARLKLKHDREQRPRIRMQRGLV